MAKPNKLIYELTANQLEQFSTLIRYKFLVIKPTWEPLPHWAFPVGTPSPLLPNFLGDKIRY